MTFVTYVCLRAPIKGGCASCTGEVFVLDWVLDPHGQSQVGVSSLDQIILVDELNTLCVPARRLEASTSNLLLIF